MIDVYFLMDKKVGEAIGGISLKEKDEKLRIHIWRTYKIYPITDKTVLFQRNEYEFCVMNGAYQHEMGTIKIDYITGIMGDKWMHINVKENVQKEKKRDMKKLDTEQENDHDHE